MKKIIAILFILVNILLFYNIREVYLRVDLVFILQIETSNPDRVHTSLIISNPNNDTISVKDSDATFEMFRYLTERFDLIISNGENGENGEIIRYMIASPPFDEVLGLVTNRSLSFHVDGDYFYTNRRGVHNGVRFFLLNNRIDVRFHPITHMGTIRGGEYFFNAGSQAELDEAVAIFMAEFGHLVDRRMEFGATPFDADEAIDSFLTPIILVAMALIFLIIVMYVHIYSKKIAVMKTMGISFFVLVRELFLPLLLLIIAAIAAVKVILFIFFVGAVNVRTVPIIWTLLQSGSMQLVGVIITLALSCLLLLLIPTYSMLKNSNINRYLMNANFVLKIIVLVMMLPALAGRIDSIQENLQMYRHVHYYERQGNIAHFEFAQGLISRYRGDGYGILWLNLLREYGDEITLDIIREHELMYEYFQAYHILRDAGAIYCQGGKMMGGEALLTVNENYLRRHPVYDFDGNAVDISSFDADIVFLVPERYMDRWFVEMWQEEGYEIFSIPNEQNLFDYSLSWRSSFGQSINATYIVCVLTNDYFMFDASPFTNVFFDGDINEALRGTRFHNRIIVSTVGDELSRISELYIGYILDEILVLVPSYLLVLVIIIQYAYLYLKAYGKRIYAKNIMGHSPFRIFTGLLVESSLAVAAAISIVWYLGLDIRLLALVLVMEVAVYLGIVAMSRHKNLLAE